MSGATRASDTTRHASADDGRDGASTDARSDRSLSSLLSTLIAQLSTLLRKEIELAKTELAQEAKRAGKAAGALGAAGFAGYMTVLMLSFAIAWGIAEVLPVWAGFLIVGVLYGIAAGVLYVTGRKKIDEFDPKPEETIETLQEDVEWAKSRTQERDAR